MARFLSKKYPGLTVKFSDGSRVKFEQSKAEVDADTAKRLREFSNAHPDYEIEQVDGDKEPTRKERLQAEARERGLDDSGTIADLEARLADADPDDSDDEDDEDQDDDEDESDPDDSDDE